MKISAFVILLLCSCSLAVAQVTAEERAEGFQPLFNGKDLDGWEGDPRLWKVEDGVIVGSAEGVTLKANSFLISRQTYGDFHVKLQVKLRNHNSCIQFRSEALPGWMIRGLQADAAENNWWGSIYDEKGGRGVLVNGWGARRNAW